MFGVQLTSIVDFFSSSSDFLKTYRNELDYGLISVILFNMSNTLGTFVDGSTTHDDSELYQHGGERPYLDQPTQEQFAVLNASLSNLESIADNPSHPHYALAIAILEIRNDVQRNKPR